MFHPETQIIFIHQGNSWYLPYALYQAQATNPDRPINLLGNGQSWRGIKTTSLMDLESDPIRQFRANYQHLSTNPREFELFCWLRWFYLFNYLQQNNLPAVLYLDSDALLYSSLEKINQTYHHFNGYCALSIPQQSTQPFIWSASAHVSYWTRESLGDFCQFCLDSFSPGATLTRYQEKWHWHCQNQKPGGICDMTTLYFFWEAHQSEILNLAKRYQGHVFDHNINVSGNYENPQYQIHNGIKRLEFIHNIPYFFPQNPDLPGDRVHLLHCQGEAKTLLPQLYRGSPFPRKFLADTEGYVRHLKQRLTPGSSF